jgi:hypothetical protein|tara:strand:+ start:97 stop:288 length:192 start_codon:yes stop_codon:yes gene_type:complete
MPYHIKKPSLINSSVTVYYAGNRRWTDDYSDRSTYENESDATALMVNNDGKNGGWTGATVVSE